jgi:hypothetical protein
VDVIGNIVRPGAPVPAEQDEVGEGIEYGQLAPKGIGVSGSQLRPMPLVDAYRSARFVVAVVVAKNLGP